MYIGSLPAASNRADYSQTFQVYDDEDNEGIDLTGATIRVEVHRPDCSKAELSAANDDGVTVLVTDEGVWRLDFTASEMRKLDPMQYEIGITIEDADGAIVQFLIGTLPVLSGIMA